MNYPCLPSADEVILLVQEDDNLGLCLYCGEDAYGVEPDARKYSCESCHRNGVFGAEEILLEGLYTN